MPNLFRNLPSVNQLLEKPQLKQLVDSVSHGVVVEGVRSFLDEFRSQLSDASGEVSVPNPNELAGRIAEWLVKRELPPLRAVINGTGILLHTGLGRAPLAEEALTEVSDLASGYASVELNLKTGQRGHRIDAVKKLLVELTGAESAVVVNNNAAATMLTLAALAAGREVVVSRGQLIEIGGSYRLPEVMECSGAVLREVGTTNKTRVADYEQAIGEQTAALMRVHPSNYEVVGFSQTVPIAEMVPLGKRYQIPVIDDVGSGALLDYAKFGLANEPLVRDSIAAGADLVLFSGDKLLGGPQCGIIVGREKYLSQIVSHPLMRAMRVGKLTLAALAATLRLYRDPERASLQIPLLRMLNTPVENLKLRAEKIVGQVEHLPVFSRCEAVPSEAKLGGGSLPNEKIATWCVALQPAEGSVDRLAEQLRKATMPVLGRVHQDRLLLDLRTIQPHQDAQVVSILEQLTG